MDAPTIPPPMTPTRGEAPARKAGGSHAADAAAAMPARISRRRGFNLSLDVALSAGKLLACRSMEPKYAGR